MDTYKIVLLIFAGFIILVSIPFLIYSIIQLISSDIKEKHTEKSMTNKKSKRLKLRVETLEEKLSQLEKLCDDRYKDVINTEKNIDSLGEILIWRQYLIDTNFIGKLKNKKLIQDWKTSFKFLYNSFSEEDFEKFKKYVLNFKFIHNPNGFFEHFRLLEQLEEKQKLLDECKEDKN